MVAGQMHDIEGTGQKLTLAELQQLQAEKTGALILAAVKMGAALAEVSFTQETKLTQFAQHFGRAFQIEDDLLDATSDAKSLGKPVHQDAAKNTYVTLLGLASAQQALNQEIVAARAALASIPNHELLASFLTYFQQGVQA